MLGHLRLVLYLFQSVTGLLHRSIPRIDHRPPSDFLSSRCSSVNVILRRWVLNLAVNLQPPRMGVLVRGS